MPSPHANLDKVGWAYIGIVIGWTTILFSAMGFLWTRRQLPHLQIRRLPLAFTSIICLHIYWTLVTLAYVIGPFVPCGLEYWFMSMLVPLGIAFFQVANTQFLHVATQQKRYASIQSVNGSPQGATRSILDGQAGSFWHKTQSRLRKMDKITRLCVYVAIGMALEIALTLLIYLLSRKFHPSFGVFPANLFGTDAENRVKCTRGWEWWLSIAWQFFWAWIYAPYILWKSRKIEDTHGWRLQTLLCCIAGLPCSPLWLCGLYLTQMAYINQYVPPPVWLAVSFFFFELFTVFVPLFECYKQHSLRAETLAVIADWETKNSAFVTADADSTIVQSPSVQTFRSYQKNFVSVKQADNTSLSSRRSHMYTMIALEHALRWNAAPLQSFAALKDFSGENVSFLMHLCLWKEGWAKQQRALHSSRMPSEEISDDDYHIRKQFNQAVRIYAAFISCALANFPINISSKTLKSLDEIFRMPAELLLGDTRSCSSNNSATPFLDEARPAVFDIEALPAVSGASSDTDVEIYYWGFIPQHFAPCVFDDAESEVKYLVLTNTWPKFVNAGFAEQIHDGQGRSLSKQLSQLFFWPRPSAL